jgi:lipopolysaccharide transport system ATP-binding protein
MQNLPIIEIQNLSKQFRIGAPKKKYAHLGDQVRDLMTGLWRRDDVKRKTVYALKGVNLTIAPGEVWGFIGRNGAGKTTLLKIISKITRPTSGKVITRGRVSALLEVGTGFHPELTGRENVYLNGSILGMKKQETEAKFDEIVEFAGIGPFIDTPVKRYSSGMQLRLAFAVAAHLEPEILVVDEVLAVGDVEFQKKCLNSMEQMKGGRTVLFVSHNLGAVRALCQKAVWLEKGEIQQVGDVDSVVQAYLRSTESVTKIESIGQNRNGGNGLVQFSSVEIRDREGEERHTFMVGEEMKIRLSFYAHDSIFDPAICLGVIRSDGTEVSFLHSKVAGHPIACIHGNGFLEVTVPQTHLMPGEYYLQLFCGGGSKEVYESIERAANFTIISGPALKFPVTNSRWGIVHLPSSWNHQSELDT